MIIEWSSLSQIQLRDIFDYYEFRVNSTLAHKIISNITADAEILLKNPNIGQIEELLIDLSFPHLNHLLNQPLLTWYKVVNIFYKAVNLCFVG